MVYTAGFSKLSARGDEGLTIECQVIDPDFHLRFGSGLIQVELSIGTCFLPGLKIIYSDALSQVLKKGNIV